MSVGRGLGEPGAGPVAVGGAMGDWVQVQAGWGVTGLLPLGDLSSQVHWSEASLG